MTFSERLEELAGIKGLTQKAIAKYAGVRYASISDWKSNESFPRADTALKIARILETTVEYLVTGKNPEGIDPKIKDMAQKIMNLSPYNIREMKKILEFKIWGEQHREEEERERELELSRNAPKGPENEEMENFNRMEEESPTYAGSLDDVYEFTKDSPPPYLGEPETSPPGPPHVAATPETEGFDNVASIDYDMVGILYLGDYAATAAGELREMLDDPGEHQIRYLPRKLIKANPEECFCIPVHGTSMTQAGISDGDVVVLKTAGKPENGEIMLVSYEGRSTLKRVAVRKDKVSLQWEDGSGKVEEINKEGYQILGKLILILKPQNPT